MFVYCDRAKGTSVGGEEEERWAVQDLGGQILLLFFKKEEKGVGFSSRSVLAPC